MNVTNGHVIDNIINGTDYGLFIWNSTNVVVTDNIVYDTFNNEIDLDGAQEVLIANNTIHHIKKVKIETQEI